MIEDELKKISIEIPTPPNPAGSYIPVVTAGNLAFVSGQIPIKDGKVVFEGKIPEPRKGLKSGNIQNSFCIPFNECINKDKTFKNKKARSG